MRIGLSVGTSFSTNGPEGHRGGPIEILNQVRAAQRGHLDSLTLGDHHATGPGGYAQNTPMLGRILAEWTERPAGCLFLVPLWNPVLMAEQIGTLATMAAAPFIIQTGLGAGGPQFRGMGERLEARAARLEEGIVVAQALLAGETVDSELFDVEGARIAPLPPEGTEWWIGAGAAKSIDRAARLGDCWYANADLTPTSAAGLMEHYREACARHDRTPVRIPIRRDVLIAENGADAEKAGDALIARGYRGFEREAVAYGDPKSVAEQLSVFGELGFTDLIIRTMVPVPDELGPDAATRSVELAAEVRSLLS